MNMDGRVLLDNLKMARDQMPQADEFDYESPKHQEWVGMVGALIKRYDPVGTVILQVETNCLSYPDLRTNALIRIRAIIQSAISDLELKYPQEIQQIYGPGATYDFYRDLTNILRKAQQNIFLIERYINDEIFYLYLSKIPEDINIQLLTGKCNEEIKRIILKFGENPSRKFEARSTNKIHDRVVIIDSNECWLLGQSIKDAAKKMPTYIAPLPHDLVSLKEKFYYEIWESSKRV